MQPWHTRQWLNLFHSGKAAVNAGKEHSWPQFSPVHPAVGLGPRAPSDLQTNFFNRIARPSRTYGTLNPRTEVQTTGGKNTNIFHNIVANSPLM